MPTTRPGASLETVLAVPAGEAGTGSAHVSRQVVVRKGLNWLAGQLQGGVAQAPSASQPSPSPVPAPISQLSSCFLLPRPPCFPLCWCPELFATKCKFRPHPSPHHKSGTPQVGLPFGFQKLPAGSSVLHYDIHDFLLYFFLLVSFYIIYLKAVSFVL